jgi:hypothetical protein
LLFRPLDPKPGDFIAQIAAMKTAFARGRIVRVNTNADGTTKWPTMIIVSHAGPSSA